MLGIFYAVITVLAWGTWLAPSQNVPFKNQQFKTFYVAIASLVLSFFVTLLQGFDQITPQVFWPPFVGGLIWTVSGYCAFTATSKIGMARASGIVLCPSGPQGGCCRGDAMNALTVTL